MDAGITVTARADGSFDVVVQDGRQRTSHVVTVPAGLAGELGAGGCDDVTLVRSSFEFLLEREPPTSILSRFGLEVIERYFPEYRREMARRLAGQVPP